MLRAVLYLISGHANTCLVIFLVENLSFFANTIIITVYNYSVTGIMPRNKTNGYITMLIYRVD